MYTIYVKFMCVPGKREAFIEKMKATGILEAVRAEKAEKRGRFARKILLKTVTEE